MPWQPSPVTMGRVDCMISSLFVITLRPPACSTEGVGTDFRRSFGTTTPLTSARRPGILPSACGPPLVAGPVIRVHAGASSVAGAIGVGGATNDGVRPIGARSPHSYSLGIGDKPRHNPPLPRSLRTAEIHDH